jgi:hypothetical protein
MDGRDRMLDGHGSPGGHDGRGNEGGDVGGARAERADGCHCAPSEHDPGRRRGPGGGRTSSSSDRSAPDPEQIGKHADGAERRGQGRELAAAAAELGLELAAPAAFGYVSPHGAAAPDATIVGQGELIANRDAGGVARFYSQGEADPRPDQERLDGRHRDIHGRGHVGVAHPSELAHEQGRALLCRQPVQIGDQSPQRLALLDLRDRVVRGPAALLQDRGRRRYGPAELVDATIVRDPVQPRAQRELATVGPKSRVGTDEDVLERVLGIL